MRSIIIRGRHADGGTAHRVSPVSANAGDRVRCSIAGFYFAKDYQKHPGYR